MDFNDQDILYAIVWCIPIGRLHQTELLVDWFERIIVGLEFHAIYSINQFKIIFRFQLQAVLRLRDRRCAFSTHPTPALLSDCPCFCCDTNDVWHSASTTHTVRSPLGYDRQWCQADTCERFDW